jgi:hypothetical protein
VNGDKLEGKGKMMWEVGDVYEGDFKNDFIEGIGEYRWSNGDVYFGDWKRDVREGKGVFTFSKRGASAGIVYEGEYKDDNRHGIGVSTYPNGKKEKQEWENDRMKTVVEVLKESSSTVIYYRLIN